ncbi:MAG: YfcE family phosphodiesterase [Patescibacteria group bacterium]|nr:YfcE family phosphodiesterase [Patescibacteria group bacterium]
MLLAVIGDIHSNILNLKKALEIIKKRGVQNLLVVGDLQSPEILDIIENSFKKTSIVLGNAEFDRELFKKIAEKYQNIEIYEGKGSLELDSKRIGFSHNDGVARKMAEEGKYDIVFSGHKHSPWEEKIKKTIYIRPGEIAGEFYKPTFCIYDLEKMEAELILINN